MISSFQKGLESACNVEQAAAARRMTASMRAGVRVATLSSSVVPGRRPGILECWRALYSVSAGELQTPEPFDDAIGAAGEVVPVRVEGQADTRRCGFFGRRRLEVPVQERAIELFVPRRLIQRVERFAQQSVQPWNAAVAGDVHDEP